MVQDIACIIRKQLGPSALRLSKSERFFVFLKYSSSAAACDDLPH